MTNMTIAQAIRRVKRLKGQMAELSRRARDVVSYREDRKPAFDYAETRDALALVREELVGLSAKISIANARTKIRVEGKELVLTEAVKLLQELRAEIDHLKTFHIRTDAERSPEAVLDETTGRYAHTYHEVKWVSAVSEPERAELMQALYDRFELINDAVEGANRTTPI